MIHALPKGAAFDTTAAEVVVRLLQAAFAPHRCWVTISEDQDLDVEVMTMEGEAVVAASPTPLADLLDPAVLASLIAQAQDFGRERVHAFATP